MEGRWPANVILSPGMARALDQQTSHLGGAVTVNRNRADGEWSGNNIYGERNNLQREDSSYGDFGGASRFFLEAGYEPEELDWIYSVGLRPYGTEHQ